MDLQLRLRSGGIGYQEILRGSTYTKKTDYSDKAMVTRFLHPVVATNNTEKLVENRTGEDGEDVERVISENFQCLYV